MCGSLGLRCLLARWPLRGLGLQRGSTRPWFSPLTAILDEIYNNCYFSNPTYGFDWGCVIRLLTGFFAFLSILCDHIVGSIDPYFTLNNFVSEVFSLSFRLLDVYSRSFLRPPSPLSLGCGFRSISAVLCLSVWNLYGWYEWSEWELYCKEKAHHSRFSIGVFIAWINFRRYTSLDSSEKQNLLPLNR